MAKCVDKRDNIKIGMIKLAIDSVRGHTIKSVLLEDWMAHKLSETLVKDDWDFLDGLIQKNKQYINKKYKK